MKNIAHSSLRNSMSNLFNSENEYNTLLSSQITDYSQSKLILKQASTTRLDQPIDVSSLQIQIHRKKFGTKTTVLSHRVTPQKRFIQLNDQSSQKDKQSLRFTNIRKSRTNHKDSTLSPQSHTQQYSLKSIHVSSLQQGQSKKRLAFADLLQDSGSEFYFDTQTLQKLYAHAFAKGDVEAAIDCLSELLIKFSCHNNILGFLRTYHLIADTYIQQDQKTNGLNVLIQLSYLCDLFHEVPTVQEQFKPKVLLDIAKLAQQFNMFDVAQAVVKKALQYAWFLKDSNLELRCFEKLGIISYLDQNLVQANYYHNRAQWGRFEIKQSTNYIMSTQNLKWHILNFKKGINSIDLQITSKATFLPFYFSTEPQNYQSNMSITNNFMLSHKFNIAVQKPRFTTKFSYNDLFYKLMGTEEFAYEMPTIKEEHRLEVFKKIYLQEPTTLLNPMEIFYHILKDKAARNELPYLGNLKNRMRKFQGFVCQLKYLKVSPQKTDKQTYRLEQGMKKMSLHKLVKDRGDLQEMPVQSMGQKLSHLRIPLKERVRISHLSPNRDLDQYALSSLGQFHPKEMFRKTLL